MFTQLLIGTLAVTLSVVGAATMIWLATTVVTKVGSWLAKPPYAIKTIATISAVTLWLMAAMTVSVWIWAGVFLSLDLFPSFEPALYFAVVSFTTLGFGDVLLPTPWRLLSGICAANGLMLFGLSAAYLFELFGRLHAAQTNHRNSASAK